MGLALTRPPQQGFFRVLPVLPRQAMDWTPVNRGGTGLRWDDVFKIWMAKMEAGDFDCVALSASAWQGRGEVVRTVVVPMKMDSAQKSQLVQD